MFRWAEAMGLDALVWTQLGPKWEQARHTPSSWPQPPQQPDRSQPGIPQREPAVVGCTGTFRSIVFCIVDCVAAGSAL
jgi:hypothetical protein